MATTTPTPDSPSGPQRGGAAHDHHDNWLESFGKAIVAPVQGAQGGHAVVHPVPDQEPKTPRTRPDARHRLPDQRDPRTVGDNGDGILQALGKAIVAPIESAHEAAVRPNMGGARSGPDFAQGASAVDAASATSAPGGEPRKPPERLK